ncbi:MAG: tannase/feruloyl esterase family alpha/beta hydrolase [Alkalilacustris sp.]
MTSRTLAAGLAPAAILSLALPAAADDACRALADLRINDVNMLSAVPVAASDDLPAFCSVRGYVRPAINFEIRLPEDWNGGFYMAGCGGFCGQLLSDAPGFVNAMNHGLRRGYAAATMDGGHWGANSVDARWAHHNRLAEVDWGERAVRTTAEVAQAVIAAHYGDAPSPRIFAGCSTGGRQAQMLALRSPGLFDGILNGAPAMNYTDLVATWMASVVQANTDAEGQRIIGPGDVALIRDHVLAQCDAADGLEDGLISDPDTCTVDWTPIACGEGTNAPCLSEAQLDTLAAWTETGAVTSTGESLYPATVPLGSEPFWGLWLTGFEGGGGGLVPVFNQGFLRFMAFRDDPGESFTSMDFDFDTHPAELAFMAAIYNADTPDLSAFAEAGGRMITWHGLADAIVPHGKTVDWFEGLRATHGDDLDAVNRLFLIPGMDHCGIQPGPGITAAGFDPLTALEAWLDSGAAPETLQITRRDSDGAVDWERPVCAWPARAVHDGTGDWRTGAGFTCTTD